MDAVWVWSRWAATIIFYNEIAKEVRCILQLLMLKMITATQVIETMLCEIHGQKSMK